MLRCAVRRKEVADTPEERVRQKLVAFLERACGVPLRAISVEVDLEALGTDATGRADLVVWKAGSGDVKRPWLLAECKAPGELVEAEVEGQVARYLQGMSPDWVVMADDSNLLVWSLASEEGKKTLVSSTDLPKWSFGNKF